MTAEIMAYLMASVFVGGFARIILDDAWWCPEGTVLAVAVLCGVLWPLTIVAALGLGLLLATCAIVRSFVALWRAVRPPRAHVPRATVRRQEYL